MNLRRLLIVDDDPEFAQGVRTLSEKMGYQVCMTNSASLFKEECEVFDPTVIILDVYLPDGDAFELVEWLAGQHYQGKLLVVTGSQEMYAEMASKLGNAKGLESPSALLKPISLKMLEAVLA